MFEKFTEPARQVIVSAQTEALGLEHNYIGTEHLLLGVLGQRGPAAAVLESFGITPPRVRAEIVRIVGRGEGAAPGRIPFTPRAKKVLQLALREALALGRNYIATGDILLGLLREGEGVAMRIVIDLGGDPDEIRARLLLEIQTAEPEAPDDPDRESRRYLTYDVARRAVLMAAAASAAGNRPVDPGDLIIALAKVDDAVREAVTRHVSLDDLAASFDEMRRSRGGDDERTG